MDIAKEVFARKRVRKNKLKVAGFTKAEHDFDYDTGNVAEYVYSEEFMGGDLTAVIRIMHDGTVVNSVVDTETGEEYLPMNIEAFTGSYVGQAREEYKALLERIADKCFDDVAFVSDQANRVAAEIERRFSAPPEHPFKSDDAAVFRNVGTGRWFAIDMCIKRGKLDDPHAARNNADKLIDVMNVKIDPDTLDDLLKKPGICRCYHMNKKMWVTLTMDDRLSDDEVLELLRRSFELTSGGPALRSGQNGSEEGQNSTRRYWLIPSNPAFFDVAKGFRDSGNDTLSWHHRISVMPGDIVYIYQTEPVASIMFECEVLESFLPRPESWGEYAQSSKYRMVLKLLRSFKKGEYPRSWMNEHGLAKTVRGQRTAPPELVKALRQTE